MKNKLSEVLSAVTITLILLVVSILPVVGLFLIAATDHDQAGATLMTVGLFTFAALTVLGSLLEVFLALVAGLVRSARAARRFLWRNQSPRRV